MVTRILKFMSEDPEMLTRMGNKPFGELVNDGFKLYGRTFYPVFIPLGLIYISIERDHH